VRWLDAWLDPLLELIIGCILLVLSGYYFWHSTTAIWEDWGTGFGTVATVVGPWFVHRAWSRRAEVLPED
jgi:hypothetical protein